MTKYTKLLLLTPALLLSSCGFIKNLIPGRSSSSSKSSKSSTSSKSSSSQGELTNYMNFYFPYGTMGTYEIHRFEENPDLTFIPVETFIQDVFLNIFYGAYDVSVNRNGSQYNYSFLYGMYNFTLDLASQVLYFPDPGYGLFFASTINEQTDTTILATGIDLDSIRLNTQKTRNYYHRDSVTLNLGAYNIPIKEYGGSAWLPVSFLSNLFFNCNLMPVSFNGKDLYVTSNFSNGIDGASKATNPYEYRYLTDTPYYGASYRTLEMAEYNYNELCFFLDYFYGLRNFRNISTFDSFFRTHDYYYYLTSTDTLDYEQALTHFIGTFLYDGHAGFLKSCPYVYGRQTFSYDYSYALSNNEAYSRLMSALDDLTNRRNYSSNYNIGLNVYENTAVIVFDQFLKSNFDGDLSEVDYYSYDELHNQDSYLLFAKAFRELESYYPEVENVVFDVTLNGGGMVDAIPWLEAFMTDDPYINMHNTLTGEVSSAHYKVDLNRDGYIGSTGDTYQGQYNFFLLTSNFSFSCGNLFPTQVKEGGMATIIGETTGGGSCAVSYLSTACGDLLRCSSTFQLGFIDTYTGEFTPNENGVIPDYSLSRDSFYSLSSINYIVNNL